MKTASQILEAKGYDNVEVDEIICIGYRNNDSLDSQVREEFEITEPIHIWEKYYIGDADEESLNELAKEKGYEDYHDLLSAMDRRLIELAEEFN